MKDEKILKNEVLGGLELYNGDCLETMDILIERGLKFDAIITDPPYNVSKYNNFGSLKDKKGNKKYNSIDFGEWDKNHNLTLWIDRADILLKHGGSFIIFCNWKDISYLVEHFKNKNYLVKNMIYWVKPNSAPKNMNRLYIVNFEVAIYVTKGRRWTFNNNGNIKKSQFIYPFVSGNEKTIHPTQKPIHLMRDLIKLHSNENDSVFDPFMGSGTTGVACINTNRKFIGIELDEKYFEIAKARVDEALVRGGLKEPESKKDKRKIF